MVSAFVKQCWSASAVLLGVVGHGMINGYPSCLVQSVTAEGSEIHVDLSTASWLASCVGITMVVGIFGASFLMEGYGRRATHAFFLLPGIIGWLLIYFAKNAGVILAGRLLSGLAMGGGLVSGSTVIGEYSSPEYRGLFLNFKAAATYIGSTSMHVLISYFDYKTSALLGTIPLVVAFCINCTWTESPSWLISKNRFDKSAQEFYWLRGSNEKSVREFEAMVLAQKNRTVTVTSAVSFRKKLLSFIKKLARKDFVKPVLIIVAAFIMLEASGRHIFQSYALDIVGDIASNKNQTLMFTISIDVISICSALVTCVLIKVLNRRTLLFYSGFTCLTVLIAICFYLFLVSTGTFSGERQWIPLSLLIIYFIISNTGCASIPLTLYGEIFPLPHRGSGTAVAGVTMALSMFVALKVAPIMFLSLRIYGTFTVMAITLGLSLTYLYITLPETRNRTLQEIEDYFNYGRFPEDYVKASQEEEKEETVRVIL